VLTQIIVEEEAKGRALLPTGFLRQLIGFYGDSVQGLVPKYLEEALENFARQQEQMRKAVEQTMETFLPPGIQEMGRQNMAMMERAMSLFAPFAAVPGGAAEPAAKVEDDIDSLRAEVERLRAELAAAKKGT